MNENVEQNIQEALIYEISDEVLEITAHTDGCAPQCIFARGGKADMLAASV